MVRVQRLTALMSAGQRGRVRAAQAARIRRFFILWCLAVAFGLLTVSRYATAAALGYQVDQLNQTLAAANAQQLSLRSEVAALGGPVTLQKESQKLGLSTPSTVVAIAMPAERRRAATLHATPSAWSVALGRLRMIIVSVIQTL